MCKEKQGEMRRSAKSAEKREEAKVGEMPRNALVPFSYGATRAQGSFDHEPSLHPKHSSRIHDPTTFTRLPSTELPL